MNARKFPQGQQEEAEGSMKPSIEIQTNGNINSGGSSPNGVTNITNIIYNFNLTPSQQLQRQQIE